MTIFMPISSKPRAACRVDGKALGIDFAASSNYKWLQGARGSGFLCVSEDCQGSVAKDLSFPGYVHFNYPRGRRNVIRPRTISRTSRPKAPAATRRVTSAMSPMPDNTALKRILALGVNNIYALRSRCATG